MATNGETALQLLGIYRYFGTTCAVRDVSFEVKRGEVFGFIGPNGAGKTTSMRILATLDVPTTGNAFVNGHSVIEDPDRVRCELGYMPDSFGTYSNVNCQEYLDFFARAYGLVGRERRRALQRVMDFTKLDGLAEKSISGLSKGMKQRLCLGRAIIHDPGTLVLDEPAAGLDPRARIELREMIGQLAAEGKSILISSHILTELAQMCDQVGIIEKGQLLAVGTVEEIMAAAQARRGDPNEACSIVVSTTSNEENLCAWLSERADVTGVTRDSSVIRFKHLGERAARAALLSDMVGAGFSVDEFRSLHNTLEDAFLHVTQGRVQ